MSKKIQMVSCSCGRKYPSQALVDLCVAADILEAERDELVARLERRRADFERECGERSGRIGELKPQLAVDACPTESGTVYECSTCGHHYDSERKADLCEQVDRLMAEDGVAREREYEDSKKPVARLRALGDGKGRISEEGECAKARLAVYRACKHESYDSKPNPNVRRYTWYDEIHTCQYCGYSWGVGSNYSDEALRDMMS